MALFDNIIFRAKDGKCLIAEVSPPFRTAFWPDLTALLASQKNPFPTGLVPEDGDQQRFLERLSSNESLRFLGPHKIGYRETADQLVCRERFRHQHFSVVFTGPASELIVAAGLELVASRLAPGANVRIRIDLQDSVQPVSEMMLAAENVLGFAERFNWRADIVLSSERFAATPKELLGLLSRFPGVRLNWLATSFVPGSRIDADSPELANMVELCQSGAWPSISLPVSDANVLALPELVMELIERTRGAEIELLTEPHLVESSGAGKPMASAEAYSGALKRLYNCSQAVVGLVSPLSWVSDRVQSDAVQVTSHFAAGCELAIASDGSVFAGQTLASRGEWKLGNVLASPSEICWEQIDAIPEMFGNSSKPQICKECEWRYRCGGVDAAVSIAQAEAERSGKAGGWLFDLYCKPRRTLFELVAWSIAEAQPVREPAREAIALERGRVSLRPANQWNPKRL